MFGCALALLAGTLAEAEWTSLAGKPAPELELEAWLAAPEGQTLADLRGFVVVLLLDGAVDLSDAKSVTRWNDLRAGWWKKGLRVVAVLKEAPAGLPPAVQFSVAVGKAPAYGSGDAPRSLVIAADGTVAWEGTPDDLTDAHIAKLVRKVRPFRVEVSGAAAKVPAVAAFRKGKLCQARMLASQAEGAGPEVQRVMERADDLLAYWQAQAKRAEGCRNYAEACECLQRIVKHFPGAKASGAAAADLKALRANKAVSKERSAADAYARLRQDLAKSVGNSKKIEALVKKAERAAKKKPATRSVERAARLVATLRSDPAVSALEAFIAKSKIDTKGERWRSSLPRPPQVEFDPDKTYFWHFETSQGPLTVKFLPEDAPMHVSSAIYLTLLGFYDGLCFHRVIPGFMAQGGCPEGSGRGRFGYKMDGEFDGVESHERRGVVSAANAGPGTDTCQFFITFAQAYHLDGKHTVYGTLVRGEKTLDRIEALGSESGKTNERIVIKKVTVSVK
ncbi:MAG: peptidylprolyl isomerase [Planctomycetota bacterium]|nr:peptidylprolyl isomerase [Planctomycetota bacterium]